MHTKQPPINDRIKGGGKKKKKTFSNPELFVF